MKLHVFYETASDGTSYALLLLVADAGIFFEFVGEDEVVPLESLFESAWVN